MRPLSIILAATPNGEIGYQNTLPWKLKGDLARFRDMTMGNIVIMGRNTYESILNGLPGRVIIVVTSQPDTIAPKNALFVQNAPSLDHAIELAQMIAEERGINAIYVAGGAGIYEAIIHSSMPCDIELTTVYKAPLQGYDCSIKNFSLTSFKYDNIHGTEYVSEFCEERGIWVLSHSYSRYKRRA